MNKTIIFSILFVSLFLISSCESLGPQDIQKSGPCGDCGEWVDAGCGGTCAEGEMKQTRSCTGELPDVEEVPFGDDFPLNSPRYSIGNAPPGCEKRCIGTDFCQEEWDRDRALCDVVGGSCPGDVEEGVYEISCTNLPEGIEVLCGGNYVCTMFSAECGGDHTPEWYYWGCSCKDYDGRVCDDEVIPGEFECEPPGVDDTGQCQQEPGECVGPMWKEREDSLGDCGLMCECSYDPLGDPSCSVAECGALCEAGNMNGETCESILGADYTGVLDCNLDDCSFDTSGCIPVDGCEVTNAYWGIDTDDDSVPDGGAFSLIVEGINCDGEEISFEVWEDDTGEDDPIVSNPVNVLFSGDQAVNMWVSEWHDDSDGNGGDPEYYFVASLVSFPAITINSVDLLSVTQTICGDGIKEGGEQCDIDPTSWVDWKFGFTNYDLGSCTACDMYDSAGDPETCVCADSWVGDGLLGDKDTGGVSYSTSEYTDDWCRYFDNDPVTCTDVGCTLKYFSVFGGPDGEICVSDCDQYGSAGSCNANSKCIWQTEAEAGEGCWGYGDKCLYIGDCRATKYSYEYPFEPYCDEHLDGEFYNAVESCVLGDPSTFGPCITYANPGEVIFNSLGSRINVLGNDPYIQWPFCQWTTG